MNLRSEAREGLQQLRKAQVIETSESLGFVATQRGDAGHERVRDELLHRLDALGHRRGGGPALRPALAAQPAAAWPGRAGPRAGAGRRGQGTDAAASAAGDATLSPRPVTAAPQRQPGRPRIPLG